MKKRRKRRVSLNRFLEEIGLTTVWTTPMATDDPDVLMYDCLLKREQNCECILVREPRMKSNGPPSIHELFITAAGPALMLEDMHHDIDDYAETQPDMTVSQVMAQWEHLIRMAQQFHDLLGCDHFHRLMSGGVNLGVKLKA